MINVKEIGLSLARFGFFLLVAAILIGPPTRAQGPNPAAPTVATTLVLQATSSGASAIFNLPIALDNHSVQVTVTGGPGSCSVDLLGSIKPFPTSNDMVDISGGAQMCSTPLFFVATKLVSSVQVTYTLTGGSSPTLTVYYAGGRR